MTVYVQNLLYLGVDSLYVCKYLLVTLFGMIMAFYAWLAVVLRTIISVYAAKYNAWQGWRPVMDITKPSRFCVFCLEVILLFSLMYTGNNPFVYATF